MSSKRELLGYNTKLANLIQRSKSKVNLVLSTTNTDLDVGVVCFDEEYNNCTINLYGFHSRKQNDAKFELAKAFIQGHIDLEEVRKGP